MNKKLEDLIKLVQAWIDRQEVQSCEGCMYWNKAEWEMPCKQCRRGCKDYWRQE